MTSSPSTDAAGGTPPDGPRAERSELERLVDAIDERVPPAPEVENTVLVDNSRLVRLTGPLFVLLSLVLVPWIVFLAVSLPSRTVAVHQDVAWAGFDLLLLAGLGGTAWCAFRRSRHLAIVASAVAAALVIDAWFDVVTAAHTAELVEAVVLAGVIELPLAALCTWLSLHSQDVASERLVLLLRRRGRRDRDGGSRRRRDVEPAAAAPAAPGATDPPRRTRRL